MEFWYFRGRFWRCFFLSLVTSGGGEKWATINRLYIIYNMSSNMIYLSCGLSPCFINDFKKNTPSRQRDRRRTELETFRLVIVRSTVRPHRYIHPSDFQNVQFVFMVTMVTMICYDLL